MMKFLTMSGLPTTVLGGADVMFLYALSFCASCHRHIAQHPWAAPLNLLWLVQSDS